MKKGYGFLSENSTFARKVEEAGIAFVGPSYQIIDECGDKTKARQLAIKTGVPVVPGSGPIGSLKEAQDFIQKHGLPVIIKAANGGGGRGMRVCSFIILYLLKFNVNYRLYVMLNLFLLYMIVPNQKHYLHLEMIQSF